MAVAAVVAGAAWWLRPNAPVADLHPVHGQNILLVTIDTLRADALSAYGGPARTPALDRLSDEGVRFDFAHAHTVLTLPSHVSILTGEYPFTHGVRENAGYRVAADAKTLATRLKEAGYATGAFVGAFPLHSRFGLNIGFDVYDDRFGETRAPTEFVMPERPATAVVSLARAWISQHQAPGTNAPGTSPPGTSAPGTSTQHPAPSTRGLHGSTSSTLTRRTSRRRRTTPSTPGAPTTARSRQPTRRWRRCSTMCARAGRRRWWW